MTGGCCQQEAAAAAGGFGPAGEEVEEVQLSA